MYPLDVSLTGLEVESSVSGMIGGGSGTLGLSDWKPGDASSAGTFKGEQGHRGYGQRRQAGYSTVANLTGCCRWLIPSSILADCTTMRGATCRRKQEALNISVTLRLCRVQAWKNM